MSCVVLEICLLYLSTVLYVMCTMCGIRYDNCENVVKKQGLISYVELLLIGTKKYLLSLTTTHETLTLLFVM